MDKSTAVSRIRSFRARALALTLTDGTPAADRKRHADLITKTHFVGKLREAEARRDIRASTLRRALTDEGILT